MKCYLPVSQRILAGVAALLATAVGATTVAIASPATGWQAYRGDDHGYVFSYPTSVFQPLSGAAETGGLALVSKDGRARLLAEAFVNNDGETLSQYRSRLLAQVYPDSTLDYAPTRNTWFVVSGVKGDQMFYHRTSFTCGGRIVNSWAMAYPVAERAVYDRIVEGIAKRYAAGRGPSGNCQLP